MIDLHSHVLPGLDDGSETLQGSLAMATMAVAEGIDTIAATPHIREDYRFPLEELPGLVAQLNSELVAEGLPIRVVGGAEVSISRVPELDDAVLSRLCLGKGRYLLVESPFGPVGDLLERALADLQGRGFLPVLAHPERSAAFSQRPDLLARIVETGVLCSVTAASMSGQFGRTVQRFTADLFTEGLVHDVASDAHDTERRPPGLAAGFDILEEHLPGLALQREWFTVEAPRAILEGGDLPPRPEPPRQPRLRGWALGRRRCT